MVNLPKSVALKATYGDAPFKYLGVEDDGKLAYSTDKVVSEKAKFAVESAGNGVTTCTKEYEDEENDPTDTDMLFSVASVAKGIVALRHLNTNKFLERIEGSQRKGSIVEPIYCVNSFSLAPLHPAPY
uniref:Uncharacterized protein n=1 Tax=Chenopodium quinoa TaxID=63459 RepID=A0A803LTD9_CHEQI